MMKKILMVSMLAAAVAFAAPAKSAKKAAPAAAPAPAAEAAAPAAAPAEAAPAAAPAAEVGEEDMVAIAYALHTFYNQHDEESDVLTIRHDDVAYSPWNQKSITF